MPKIFINSGHCIGKDAGACGNGLQEADVALAISEKVAGYLRAVGYSVKVFYYDGLQQICDDANDWNADLFVSIHCNAANGTAHGTETFHTGSGKGKRLAECIQNQIISKVGTFNRGIKEKGFYVIRYTVCPSVLVETAFIDNPKDAKLLIERQDDFARAIACGVTDYYATDSISTKKPMPDKVDIPNKSATALSEHFDVSEFACHHCGQCAAISPRLIELLEKLRAKVGAPLHINSGYRCPVHNANVGGVPNSQHVLGTAADVAVPVNMSFDQFRRLVTTLPFDWVGLYPDSYFIHVDTRNGGVGYHQGDWMQ